MQVYDFMIEKIAGRQEPQLMASRHRVHHLVGAVAVNDMALKPIFLELVIG
jgi:hypothetical protein